MHMRLDIIDKLQFPVEHLQPSTVAKESSVIERKPPQSTPKASVIPASSATAHDTGAMPPKRRRVAHTLKKAAVSQPIVPAPDTVPEQPTKHKVPVQIKDVSPSKKGIFKIVNWRWDVDNNGLTPVNRQPNYGRIYYRDIGHWKACVFSPIFILI